MKKRKILSGEVYPRASQYSKKELRAFFKTIAEGPETISEYPELNQITRKKAAAAPEAQMMS